MKRILVATDFSERSYRAVRRAALLAQASGASVLLLHVTDDDRDANLVAVETAAAREMLETLKNRLLAGLPCEALVAPGDPFDGIVRVARKCEADLVVMGAHRKQLLRDIFIGTSVERVTRARVAPVLMVNREPAGAYARALACVDLSEHSAYAMRFARKTGIVPASGVAVVNAFDAMAKGKLGYAGVPAEEIARYVAQVEVEARSQVAAFLATHAAGEPAPFAIHLAEGRAMDVIALAADMLRADVAVLATHGRTGLPRLMLGSVTEEAMRSLECDILAVPPPQD